MALINGGSELGQIEVFNPPSFYDGFPTQGLFLYLEKVSVRVLTDTLFSNFLRRQKTSSGGVNAMREQLR